jgi:two-component system, NarL family, nitrate/nitrite response regulator NarL
VLASSPVVARHTSGAGHGTGTASVGRMTPGATSALEPTPSEGAWERRVLLVEDEPLLASLMVEVLRGAGLEVAHVATAVAARELVDDFDPDAALVDVHLGSGPSGLHLAHVLARTHPHVGVLLLSRFADLSAAGLDGFALPDGSMFIPKDRIVDTGVLLGAIDAVLAGRPGPVPDHAELGPLQALSRAQLAVLRLVAGGLNNAAIAVRRGTSERSVEQHLQGVYAALGIELGGELNPRVEAVRRYVEIAGLPELDGSGLPVVREELHGTALDAGGHAAG